MSFLRRFELPSGDIYDNVFIVVDDPVEFAIERSIELYEADESNFQYGLENAVAVLGDEFCFGGD